MTATASVADFLGAWEARHLDARAGVAASALEQARRSWFDTLAATVAGTRERCTRAAIEACTLAGGGATSAWDDALLLGTASHALDYDDVCMLATCHPSAPPVAALLALLPTLERLRPGARLDDLLAAYLVGTETALRLGQWLGFRHYALGFHATATLGTVGAAAACAHALDLPSPQARVALSIAASSACGLRANFGTDVKPLHVGFAAAAALRAGLLAASGASASDDVWNARGGFVLAFDGGQIPGPLRWRRGMPWAIESPGFEHKRFPSCYMTHRMIAGVLALRQRHAAEARATATTIEVEVPMNGLSALNRPMAVSGLEAKFSGPYCAAAAWLDGRVDLKSFADAAVQRPAVRELMQRVSLRERDDPAESLDSAPARVTVRGPGWHDGFVVDWAPGSMADPLSRTQFLDKWADCGAHAGSHADPAPALRLFDAPGSAPASSVLMPLRSMLIESMRLR